MFVSKANSQGEASLYFSPSSGNKAVGSTFSLEIKVNTAGNAINAAEGSIVFDPSKMQVVSVSKVGSIFTLWAAEPSFSNADGTIDFGGGIPSPGYSGSNGTVITINFFAKTATTVRGYTEVVMVSGAILANDGQGTNILSSLGKANFFLSPSGVEQAPVTGVEPGLNLVIKSSTHPDQTKWYSNNNPAFEWSVPRGVNSVKLLLSHKSLSVPRIVYRPPIAAKIISDIDDGIWYLHGQFDNGPIGSYKFQVDTKPPADFTISRSDTNDDTNPQPELLFETTDETSGVDHYEVKVGDNDWFSVAASLAGKPYKLPLQAPGEHEVKIRAYDQAGNFSEASYLLKISSIESAQITRWPVKIKIGENLTIDGKSKPFAKIKVYISSNPVELNVVADKDGNWSVTYDHALSKGTHAIRAYVVDERGAVSISSNIATLEVTEKSLLLKTLDSLKNIFNVLFKLITEGWFIILAAIIVAGLIKLFIIKIVPYLKTEFAKISYISREYKVSKKLKKQNRKVYFELKTLSEDLQKELALLKRIEQHRTLHPEEKYWKEKLQKYYNIIKTLK